MNAIEPRRLGTSDVMVSPVIFGAWAIGGWMWGGTDEADAVAAIQAGIDHGVTTIDTAAIYGYGYSEELVARAIKGRRDKVQIATKCGMRWDTEEGADPWPMKDRDGNDVIIRKNSKPESVAYECEQSLERLGVDVIDIYQVHWPDSTTPVEDTMHALIRLKEQGKIRAIGVSNYDVPWMERASAVVQLDGFQPPFSLIQRKIEPEILPYCREHEIGVIVYSPLERGLLTGTVPPDRVFPEGDHRAKHKFFTEANRERVMESLDMIRPIADKHGVSLAQLVINWTIHQPGITAALVGARNAEQSAHNAKALTFRVSDLELSVIRHAFDDCSKAMTALIPGRDGPSAIRRVRGADPTTPDRDRSSRSRLLRPLGRDRRGRALVHPADDVLSGSPEHRPGFVGDRGLLLRPGGRGLFAGAGDRAGGVVQLALGSLARRFAACDGGRLLEEKGVDLPSIAECGRSRKARPAPLRIARIYVLD